MLNLATVYNTEAFRLLSQGMKDHKAAQIVYSVMFVDMPTFETFEQWAHKTLGEKAEVQKMKDERETERTKGYYIGELTRRLVFDANKITNANNTQLVLNAVEQALVDQRNALIRDASSIHEQDAVQIAAQKRTIEAANHLLHDADTVAVIEGFEHNTKPADVIRQLVARVERLKGESAASEGATCGNHAYNERVDILHEKLFHDDPTDEKERFARCLEELLELGQVLGIGKHEIPKLIERVYSRPIGEIMDELGGVAMTFASLCKVLGTTIGVAAHVGLSNLEQHAIIEKVRTKRKTRHGRGLLPGFDPSVPAKDELAKIEWPDKPQRSIIGDNDGPWEQPVTKEPQTIGEVMKSRDFATGEPRKKNVARAQVAYHDDGTVSVKLLDKNLPPGTYDLKVDGDGITAVPASWANYAAYMHSSAIFQLGNKVKKRGKASWRGNVVGIYSTTMTPIGYAVESAFEPGSVQIYPESAIEYWDGK